MKIFMWLSLANFSFFWSLLCGTYICELQLDNLFLRSTFFVSPSETNWLALEVFVKVVPFLITFFYNMVIALNTCLCLDLVWTLRSPFKKPESRYPSYFGFSILAAWTPAILRITVLANPER